MSITTVKYDVTDKYAKITPLLIHKSILTKMLKKNILICSLS